MNQMFFTENADFFLLIAVDCGSLPDPKNGKKTVETRTTFGGRAEFRCRSKGFSLDGSKLRFCQANGNWSGKPTSCRGKVTHSLLALGSCLSICRITALHSSVDL